MAIQQTARYVSRKPKPVQWTMQCGRLDTAWLSGSSRHFRHMFAESLVQGHWPQSLEQRRPQHSHQAPAVSLAALFCLPWWEISSHNISTPCHLFFPPWPRLRLRAWENPPRAGPEPPAVSLSVSSQPGACTIRILLNSPYLSGNKQQAHQPVWI